LPDLDAANPRSEVPALGDGDLKIFDSTVNVQYLEDKYAEKPLLPESPADHARVRMLEEIRNTHYEAMNWAYGEIHFFERATGELAEKLVHQVKHQTTTVQIYLGEQLGDKTFFNGSEFGYGDTVVAPIYNRSFHYGFAAPENPALAK
jgi:RNA polymerase-associated protein